MKRFLFLLCCLHASAFTRAITYETPSGRFGDQLIAYMHAKWVSYLYDIPLLYKPFHYSADLVLDDKEQLFQGAPPSIYVTRLSLITENQETDALFTIPYFPECSYELKRAKWYHFPIDWHDPTFLAILRTHIYPKTPLTFPDLPQERTTVAVHVRKGGGFDDPAQLTHWPLKFPPDAFYIDSIKKIYELTKQPLFVYIFTDDPEPLAIAHHFKTALADSDILFDCRSEGNNHKTNVLADMFDMMRYDCLIRPESNYSIVAERLASY